IERQVLEAEATQQLAQRLDRENGEVGQVAVDDLPRKEAGAVGGLDHQSSAGPQCVKDPGSQDDQLVAREMLQDVHRDYRLELVAPLAKEVEDIGAFSRNAAPRGQRDLLRGDVDAHGVRESALPEIREQPARAATDLENGRRAVEVFQKRQVFVVPPDSRW